MTVSDARNNNDPPAKLYVTVVTLSTENDKKLLEQLKPGVKRTMKWNKHRSQMSVQSSNNNLNYLIDSTFPKINRLFVLSFERIAGVNNTIKDHRDSFSHHHNKLIWATMFFIIRRNYFWIFAKFCKHLVKMETQKIVNLLNSSENEYLKFATRK